MSKQRRKKCMAGLPPNYDLLELKIPYGGWEEDTLITDSFGNPIYSVLDLDHHSMGLYRAIIGDQHGSKLVYVNRRLIRKPLEDGWDFCTYTPNFIDQPEYKEKDLYGNSVYPYSYLEIHPSKSCYRYSIHQQNMQDMDLMLEAMQSWLGATTICCTPFTRLGKWSIKFHQPGNSKTELKIDQQRNLLTIQPGNDVLAAFCISYAFDKALCQPMVTIIGYQETEYRNNNNNNNNSTASSKKKKKSNTKSEKTKKPLQKREVPAIESDPIPSSPTKNNKKDQKQLPAIMAASENDQSSPRSKKTIKARNDNNSNTTTSSRAMVPKNSSSSKNQTNNDNNNNNNRSLTRTNKVEKSPPQQRRKKR